MNTLDDPFDYPEPFKPQKTAEQRETLAEKRRVYRAKKLGRSIGKHGGYRKGAGRKRVRPWTHQVFLELQNIQLKLLLELGNGDLNKGVQKLVETHV